MMQKKYVLLGCVVTLCLYAFTSIHIGPNYAKNTDMKEHTVKRQDTHHYDLRNKLQYYNSSNFFSSSKNNEGTTRIFPESQISTKQHGIFFSPQDVAENWNSLEFIENEEESSLESRSLQLSRADRTRILERIFKHARTSGRIFYNRVPKCGSEGVAGLIRTLSRQNHFYITRSHIYQERFLNDSQQLDLVKYIQDLQPPVVFDRHVYFTDFTKFSIDNPVYINVIRDPVERFISAYYYNKKFCRDDVCRNQTVEQCIARKSPICTFVNPPSRKNRMWMVVPFFCGHAEFCKVPSREALELAKKNAAESYLVVGILEDLTRFYYILEKGVPHLFTGIHKLYIKRKILDKDIRHSTKGKPQTSNEAREHLKKQLHLEYEFYDFAKKLVSDRIHFIESSDFFRGSQT